MSVLNRFLMTAVATTSIVCCERVCASDAADAGSPVAGNDASIAEIVITANKREQDLGKVGSSVAALGAAALESRRIENIEDLAQATPGLVVAPSQDATPVFTLRGVGFFESTLASAPDVSVYLDQVPLVLPTMTLLTAFDLERVEVLKGPQGTLFGNNATGGAINFVAAKPTKDWEGKMEVSYGRFETTDIDGYVSGPISDTVRFRLALKTVHSDDWQKSYANLRVGPGAFLSGTLGKQDNVAGRFIVDWDAADNLKFSLNLNGWRDQDDPEAPQKVGIPPGIALVPPMSYPTAPADARAAGWDPDYRPFMDTRFKQATLRADYSFSGLTLTSLSGYANLKFLTATEGSGTPAYDLDIFQNEGDSNSITQELRLANDSSQRARWVVGLNYEHTNTSQGTVVGFSEDTVGFATGIGIGKYTNEQRVRNYAAFANLEFDLTDELTAKAGVRQTRSERFSTSFNGDNRDWPPILNRYTGKQTTLYTDFFNAVYGAVYGGVVPTIGPYQSIIIDNRLNPDGTPTDPATYLKTGSPVGNLDQNSTSWSAGLDYKLTAGTLLYLNVARGFKGGSFAQAGNAIYSAYEPVVQESLLDVEGGWKAHFFDRRLSVNGSAFYYDYTNKQLRAKFIDPIFGALDALTNIPKSEIVGVDLDVNAHLIHGLTLSASATYLPIAKVKDYTGAIGAMPDPVAPGLLAPILASFEGARLPFAPKVQYVVRLDYETPLRGSIWGFLGVGVNGQSNAYGVLTPVPSEQQRYELNPRALVNLSGGIHSEDDRWRLTFWSKNVFNRYYWTNTFQSQDNIVRYAGRPVEYGASVSYRF